MANKFLFGMYMMDDDTIQERNEEIQQVIDLTVVNGEAYIHALKEFNSRFKKNTNSKIINEKQLYEQFISI